VLCTCSCLPCAFAPCSWFSFVCTCRFSLSLHYKFLPSLFVMCFSNVSLDFEFLLFFFSSFICLIGGLLSFLHFILFFVFCMIHYVLFLNQFFGQSVQACKLYWSNWKGGVNCLIFKELFIELPTSTKTFQTCVCNLVIQAIVDCKNSSQRCVYGFAWSINNFLESW
jgi:hypothetical protein